MFRRLWSLLRPVKRPDFAPGPYRPYTTQFDIEADGAGLASSIGMIDEMAYQRDVGLFEEAMASWRLPAGIAGMESLERIVTAAGDRPLAGTVVSLLVDHSRSMRGQRAILALVLIELLTDHCLRLGAAVEILGYTTVSWHGGESRETWRRAGKPKNPGRLCDLLHIIYRTADETAPGAGWSIRNLLREQLLKENVDGEAVQWACARLRARAELRKILIGISDGAPVDDSTLLENGPKYLDAHMREVMAGIAATGDIEPVGIGIDHDLTRYYTCFARVTALGDYAARVLPLLEGLFTRPAPSAGPSLH
jgi:cobaltochelatase CobT